MTRCLKLSFRPTACAGLALKGTAAAANEFYESGNPRHSSSRVCGA